MQPFNVRENTEQIINAMAPIRICDLGGWTDTWFAEQGAVFNIGVYPYAEVQIYVARTPQGQDRGITIHAENFGDRYRLPATQIEYDRHPLIEAGIDIMNIPDNLSFEVNLYSIAPAGCSTGTSAAVTVALLAGLDMLTGGRRTPYEIAHLAHRVETEQLGLQCGIQDQLCSAYGGICYIQMFEYPHASVSQITLPNSIWWELERRMLLIYLGRTHSSSDVHKQVIARLEKEHADKSGLEALRGAARDGKNALYQDDFRAFGQAMIRNTEAQRALHPALVSETADKVIALARDHGCEGWKVNGAGGEGGSLSILCGPENELKRAFINNLEQADPGLRVIPTYLSRMGIRRWQTRK
jgi:D-glycero-alpha-D-manno-heptose-7-phosphate kinase